MKYLLLVSHGGLAEGLKVTLSMFAGDKIDQVLAKGLAPDQSLDSFASQLKEELSVLEEQDSVVVLADIVGGSPLTTTCNVLDELGLLDQAVVLGGVNLSMALTSLVMMDALEGEDLVTAVLTEASSALQEFTVAGDDEDEDDI